MTELTNTITNAIATIIAKPAAGVVAPMSGSLAYVLHIIGILNPILAFFTTCIGFGIGCYHIYKIYKGKD